MQEVRARVVTMTIHNFILGTKYSSTVFFVTGALHVQLHKDDIDDVMILNVWDTDCRVLSGDYILEEKHG